MLTPFTPIRIRDLQVSNRLWMSPMCTYSAAPTGDATASPNDFHLAHYTARAAGGAGLVMIEATGVRPDGRISPYDLGLWNDAQTNGFTRLTASIRAAGAVPAIQLAHAGRKASVDKPWRGGDPVGAGQHGWIPVGPSPIPFPDYPEPAELTVAEIGEIVTAFAEAAVRALAAGFDVVEVHAAHGYLLHSFLSPASNTRTDQYGGSFENRIRFPLEVIDAVRAVWPEDHPVFLRVSTTDWIEENPDDDRSGWTVNETVDFARIAGQHGIDLIDGSSGGTEPAPIPRERDYQTRNTERIKTETGLTVAAVGRISDPAWAAELISGAQADAVFLGRSLLRDASWINNAATTLGDKPRYLEQYNYAL